MNNCVVDFGKLGGRAYVGRPNGEAARDYFEIMELVKACDRIKIMFPDDTKTLTSSYFLGCFSQSIIEAGSLDKFRSKFDLDNPHKLDKIINKCIQTALISVKP